MDEKFSRDSLLSELRFVYKLLVKLKPPRAATLTTGQKRKFDACIDLHRLRIYCLQVASGPVKDAELDAMSERLKAIEGKLAGLGST
jgi:hypothetical protein